uniref:Putative secreted protein n=1 Tax=Anopheles marajoara TaxID=58244 RepID=A0A2M4CEP7_9DIPT
MMIVGMVAITHVLLQSLRFNHAFANITDHRVEWVRFGTDSVQSHIGSIQPHHTSARPALNGTTIRCRPC